MTIQVRAGVGKVGNSVLSWLAFVNLTKAGIPGKRALNGGIDSLRLGCGRVCGSIFLLNDCCERCLLQEAPLLDR